MEPDQATTPSNPPTRISIALATYQGERYLSQQLESYLSQTRLPDEICVGDDGSTDSTVPILNAFACRAPFSVHVQVHKTPQGPNRNFQSLLERCTGDVILFSDQDDVWLPEHVERLVQTLEQDPRLMAVSSNSRYYTESLEQTQITVASSERFPARLRDATMRLPAKQFELVVRHRISAGHGMAIRASLVPLLIPFSDLWIYDRWVFLLAAAAGFVNYVPESLTMHRMHSTQTEQNRELSLSQRASRSATVSAAHQTAEEESWRALLDRVRERRDFIRDPTCVEAVLEQKIDFISRRGNFRNDPLPRRALLAMRELCLGRYHSLGRGFLTFARDLYGVGPRRGLRASGR